MSRPGGRGDRPERRGTAPALPGLAGRSRGRLGLRRLGLDRRQRRPGPVVGRRGGRARHEPAVLGGEGQERRLRAAERGRAGTPVRDVPRRRLRGRRRLARPGQAELEARPRARGGLRPTSGVVPRSVDLQPPGRPGMGHADRRGDRLRRRLDDPGRGVRGGRWASTRPPLAGEEPELCQRLRKKGWSRSGGSTPR